MKFIGAYKYEWNLDERKMFGQRNKEVLYFFFFFAFSFFLLAPFSVKYLFIHSLVRYNHFAGCMLYERKAKEKRSTKRLNIINGKILMFIEARPLHALTHFIISFYFLSYKMYTPRIIGIFLILIEKEKHFQ